MHFLLSLDNIFKLLALIIAFHLIYMSLKCELYIV